MARTSIQLDIKNVFLHEDLAKEVHMEQPPGFVAQGKIGRVCRLRKSLYGLKQSPRAWFSKFNEVIEKCRKQERRIGGKNSLCFSLIHYEFIYKSQSNLPNRLQLYMTSFLIGYNFI